MIENILLNLRGVESGIRSQENFNCLNDILWVVVHVFTAHVSMDTLGVEFLSKDKVTLCGLFLVSNRVAGSKTGTISFFSDVGLSVFHVSEACELSRTDKETFTIEGELGVHQPAEYGHDLSLALFLDSRRGSSSSSFFGRRSNLKNISENRLSLNYLGLELIDLIFRDFLFTIHELHLVVIRFELNNFATVVIELAVQLGNRHVLLSTSKSLDLN